MSVIRLQGAQIQATFIRRSDGFQDEQESQRTFRTPVQVSGIDEIRSGENRQPRKEETYGHGDSKRMTAQPIGGHLTGRDPTKRPNRSTVRPIEQTKQSYERSADSGGPVRTCSRVHDSDAEH